MHILRDHSPGGNAVSVEESATLDTVMPFAWDWMGVADQLIGSGFCNPGSFDGLDVRPDDLPTDLHCRLLKVVRAASAVGIKDLQICLDHIFGLFPDWERPDVKVIALSDGSGVNSSLFARWCREHGRRAKFFRGAQRALADARPIGDLARELLGEVTR